MRLDLSMGIIHASFLAPPLYDRPSIAFVPGAPIPDRDPPSDAPVARNSLSASTRVSDGPSRHRPSSNPPRLVANSADRFPQLSSSPVVADPPPPSGIRGPNEPRT